MSNQSRQKDTKMCKIVKNWKGSVYNMQGSRPIQNVKNVKGHKRFICLTTSNICTLLVSLADHTSHFHLPSYLLSLIKGITVFLLWILVQSRPIKFGQDITLGSFWKQKYDISNVFWVSLLIGQIYLWGNIAKPGVTGYRSKLGVFFFFHNESL